jgi:hypothetical protein
MKKIISFIVVLFLLTACAARHDVFAPQGVPLPAPIPVKPVISPPSAYKGHPGECVKHRRRFVCPDGCYHLKRSGFEPRDCDKDDNGHSDDK